MRSLRSVSKSFAAVQALRDVSLDVERGEIHAIVGENEAGTSTLMRTLVGALSDDDGHLLLDGQPISFSSPRNAQSHSSVASHEPHGARSPIGGWDRSPGWLRHHG